MSETLHLDAVVVGAGVVGLAVARARALTGREAPTASTFPGLTASLALTERVRALVG